MSHVVKKLGIGEFFVAEVPVAISTILGSCVSVCLYSNKFGIGGMIHFALPDRSHAANSLRNDFNFGDTAIGLLVEELNKAAGEVIKDLQAKIVGGAKVIKDFNQTPDIGALNILKARMILRNLHIPITGEHVGGNSGRLIYFYSDSGRLRVALTDSQAPVTAPRAEVALKKKVLIIDDSKTMREILKSIFNMGELEVVGTAASAEEAYPLIKMLSPDVITLDIHMPGMDGVSFLEKYFPLYPIPTVMISSVNVHESNLVMRALEIGAVDYLQKPTLAEIKELGDFMREKVLTASQVKIKKNEQQDNTQISYLNDMSIKDKFIAIGASTGGTQAIKDVLQKLPKTIPPILIVQHIPPIFSTAFTKRLNEVCPFEVIEGKDGDEVLPGRVIVAPGGMQMEVLKINNKYVVKVFDGERVNRHKPSVDVLFNSVARHIGKNAIGIILTGMGNDGAQGLLKMKEAGAFTMAQDEHTSVVYGMPRIAVEIGAVDKVVSLQRVPFELTKALKLKESA